jgi:hydrogenase maturation protein HypF
VTETAIIRRRLLVTGTVQGVGFRPFVHRLAVARGLAGFVQNTTDGVTIEVEGPADRIDAFVLALRAEAPPLARLADVAAMPVSPLGSDAFTIVASASRAGRTWIPPDVGLCDACRRELRDPGDRRHRHPFVTCTDCGPRYTVIRAMPYDRDATTMAAFPMCAACAAEYRSAGGRRFHAETIACHDCGPRLGFVSTRDPHEAATGAPALARALDTIEAGGIVAVKGVGGYHLACDAASAEAVDRLRARKHRPHKPFAVLVADLARADGLAELSPAARDALVSPARPIVLVERRAGADLAQGVAPSLRHVGLMLPHAPLHELMATDWLARRRVRRPLASGALVLTSGNRSEDPVAIDDDDARARLSDVADAFLAHDRRIQARSDDSVVADAGARAPVPVRRSRGFAPSPIALPHARAPILAVGGELKAACCLAVDGQAVVGPHVGDMEHPESLDAFTEIVDHLCRLFGVEPDLYVCDLHPGYLSAHWASQASHGRVARVQHHHAHAASLMAEHAFDLDERLVTICFDGTGYGEDGAIWGGEVLDAGYASYRRLAHLAYAPLVGGDAAIRHPGRLALAYLSAAGVPPGDDQPVVRRRSEAERRLVAEQLQGGVGQVPTSSMGRLFDVVAAIAGVRDEATYEGQAAMELEDAVVADDTARRAAYRFTHAESHAGALAIDWRPVVCAAARDAAAGVAPGVVAGRFHDAVAAMVVDLVSPVMPSGRAARVGLTGGVFQNRLLTRLVVERLEARGLGVLTHRLVPPNDGGLSLGQAAVAAARHRTDERS